jgi:hypothetical protein
LQNDEINKLQMINEYLRLGSDQDVSNGGMRSQPGSEENININGNDINGNNNFNNYVKQNSNGVIKPSPIMQNRNFIYENSFQNSSISNQLNWNIGNQGNSNLPYGNSFITGANSSTTPGSGIWSLSNITFGGNGQNGGSSGNIKEREVKENHPTSL